MKPHPRIRKTVKWAGAAVTVLLLLVWISSGRWGLAWVSPLGSGITVFHGQITVVWIDGDFPGTNAKLRTGREARYALLWRFQWARNRVGWVCFVPLWALFAIASSITSVPWVLDGMGWLRASAGLCPKCGYDRTGLPLGAVCPECGSNPS